MVSSELKEFFDNVYFMSSFERKKKIYELTNDLDSYLIEALRDEASTFYRDKMVDKLVEYSDSNGGFSKEMLDENVQKNRLLVDEGVKIKDDDERTGYIPIDGKKGSLVNFFNSNFFNVDYEVFRDVIEESSEFLYELDELVKRSHKLSKNPELSRDSNEEGLIEFSDTTFNSRIVFLEKLGVIQFLRKQQPFSTSVNSMATILSAIIGAKATTVQSMINPMLSADVDGKNNPMNSTKAVKVVDIQLAKIGYKS
ncbi:hypothetical protein [Flavobacterium ginsenosidimutans]|uniref:hypothetical protein n=1 Tax=Flavobacterium ginsenosidimutans TaxID=687844 RepID=UPI000DABA650|nr:hypothetical protein [Flavobacterium ginsenosidimutans]KAF2338041.1 hypothetical protein DM444_01290 [Flavobacterium ginsenosidimutans]